MPENLKASADRADLIRPLLPESTTMAEVALRFILENKTVGTIIPGMRKQKNVIANINCSDGVPMDPQLYAKLKVHRWDRKPTSWSQ